MSTRFDTNIYQPTSTYDTHIFISILIQPKAQLKIIEMNFGRQFIQQKRKYKHQRNGPQNRILFSNLFIEVFTILDDCMCLYMVCSNHFHV